MRAIVLTNSWLSGLQKGLQAGHALVEMSLDAKYHNLYRDWASEHKTLIVLEGGSHLNLSNFLEDLKQMPQKHKEDINFSYFYEDLDSLNGSMTAVAMIVSDKYEGYLGKFRQRDLAEIWLGLSSWEQEFFAKLASCRLAS